MPRSPGCWLPLGEEWLLGSATAAARGGRGRAGGSWAAGGSAARMGTRQRTHRCAPLRPAGATAETAGRLPGRAVAARPWGWPPCRWRRLPPWQPFALWPPGSCPLLQALALRVTAQLQYALQACRRGNGWPLRRVADATGEVVQPGAPWSVLCFLPPCLPTSAAGANRSARHAARRPLGGRAARPHAPDLQAERRLPHQPPAPPGAAGQAGGARWAHARAGQALQLGAGWERRRRLRC